jgi:transketolase
MEKSFTMKKGADTIYSSTHPLEKRETSNNALWKSLSISIMMLVGLTMNAQVTVTGDAAGTYADLGAAITALNAITGATLTQNTVVTVAAGNAQTAPAGGYVVNVTGTSTASLSFVGNGNTISTPVQTANSILDAAIKFIGSDFVTFSGFTINASAGTVKVPASNDRTEWGIAFLAASATDGC